MRFALSTLLGLMLLAPLAAAQDPPPAAAARGGADCPGGLALDDGTAETGYGWIPSVPDGEYVQRARSRRIDCDGRARRRLATSGGLVALAIAASALLMQLTHMPPA